MPEQSMSVIDTDWEWVSVQVRTTTDAHGSTVLVDRKTLHCHGMIGVDFWLF